MEMSIREALNRYGLFVVLLLVQAMLVVFLPGSGGDDAGVLASSGVTDTGSAAGSSATGPGASSGVGGTRVASTGEIAGPAGAAGSVGGGGVAADGSVVGTTGAAALPPGATAASPGGGGADGVAMPPGMECRADGQMASVSWYSPPCVSVFTGDNGGSTSRGVTDDTIVVASLRYEMNPAVSAILTAGGAGWTEEQYDATEDIFRRYFNTHVETYGREVVIKVLKASGASDDEEAQRADAIRIAEEVGAFGFVSVGPIGSALASELASRGVVVLGTVLLDSEYYRRNNPYIFGVFPPLDVNYLHVGEYMTKRLAGKPAKWAGDATLQAQPRKFGLIWLSGYEEAKRSRDRFEAYLAERGIRLAAEASFTFDLSRGQEQATNIIVKMKQAGVSNIIFVGDPLYPIFLTQEASRQVYFPEWLISGTYKVDTTFFGRTYDQAQWAHAFGVSPLYLFKESTPLWPGPRACMHMLNGDQAAYDRDCDHALIHDLFGWMEVFWNGLHMAGPNLTPDTFAQGMYAAPRVGGQPAHPLRYFTRDDPMAIKDFTEVWWDVDAVGEDELDTTGQGLLMKSNNGRRYELGGWPAADPFAFVDDPAPIYSTDDPPEGRDPAHEGHSHGPEERCRSCAR